MHDGQESELKFFFEPRDLSKIKALPLLKDALPQANYQRLVSTYFDTPNKYLWKHGVSLRVRQNEQGLVQTLKQQKSSALDRGEWEAKVNRNLPDIDALKKTPLASFFKKRRVRERLQANFAVEVERLSITLAIGESRLEAAVDQGSVKAEGRSIPVNELELELKEGEKPALFELARAFLSERPSPP
jgi:triphosphatase